MGPWSSQRARASPPIWSREGPLSAQLHHLGGAPAVVPTRPVRALLPPLKQPPIQCTPEKGGGKFYAACVLAREAHLVLGDSTSGGLSMVVIFMMLSQ